MCHLVTLRSESRCMHVLRQGTKMLGPRSTQVIQKTPLLLKRMYLVRRSRDHHDWVSSYHGCGTILWGLNNFHILIVGRLRHSDYDIIIRGTIAHYYPFVLCPLKAIGFDGAVTQPSTLVKLLALFPKINRPVRCTNSGLHLTSQDALTSALECLCKISSTGDIL